MVIKRKAKRGGHDLSLLGMGAMRLPTLPDGHVDQEKVDAMVAYLFEHGVNYFDTAYFYHNKESEAVLAKALRRYPRDQYLYTTKLPLYLIRSEDDLDKLFDEQLARSGLDYFDYYLMHAVNPVTVHWIEKYRILPWIEKKKKEGKIRFVGFSIHAPYETLVHLLDLYDWDIGQIQLNYMDFDDRPGIKGYKELVKREKDIIIMEPVKGGLLANLGDVIGAPLKAINPNVSFASYGYRFLMDMPDVSVILSGASTLQQVQDNVSTFSVTEKLTTAEYQAIEEVKATIQRLQKVNCTNCGYCMPCPFGVDIPQNFKAWNNTSMFQGVERVWASGFDYPVKKAAAENCQNCGVCVKLCPQAIPIPEKLAQLVKEKNNA